ncbi:MAG: hypothetical protein DRQ47_10955 [Gammaproteobacteria bacterium]|nr:MAG: hypothetical protein DRQ47_10955 [Gammaproteobacteria bacterium]
MQKKYKLIEGGVVDVANNISIPENEKNRHWKEFKKWESKGNKPDPIETSKEKADRVQAEETAAALKTARDASEFNGLSTTDAEALIDSKLDSASTVAALKTAVKDVLKGLFPLIQK